MDPKYIVKRGYTPELRERARRHDEREAARKRAQEDYEYELDELARIEHQRELAEQKAREEAERESAGCWDYPLHTEFDDDRYFPERTVRPGRRKRFEQ